MESLIPVNFQNLKEFELSGNDSEFFPYACHYNHNTILTKNGELLQTIKIIGFSSQLLSSGFIEIKNIIQNIIKEQIKDKRFAIYFQK